MTTKICEYCGREITTCNYSKHIRSHENGNFDKRQKEYEKAQHLDHDDLFCKYCGKECTDTRSLIQHETRCKNNPYRKPTAYEIHPEAFKNFLHSSWNKGLTAESDFRIKNQKETFNKNQLLGLHTNFGHKHSDKTKELLRDKALNNNYRRKCKKAILYKSKNGSYITLDSSYELKLAEILDELNLNWCRPSPLIWIDSYNKKHNYFSDFYLLDYDIYLDPKNDYCFIAQKEKLEILKNTYTNVFFLKEEDISIDYIENLLAQFV